MVSAIQLEEYGIQLTTGIQKKIKNFSDKSEGKTESSFYLGQL